MSGPRFHLGVLFIGVRDELEDPRNQGYPSVFIHDSEMIRIDVPDHFQYSLPAGKNPRGSDPAAAVAPPSYLVRDLGILRIYYDPEDVCEKPRGLAQIGKRLRVLF